MKLDELTIGHTELTSRVFLGKLSKDKSMWLHKKDITTTFEMTAVEYFKDQKMTSAFQKADGTVDVYTLTCKCENMTKEEYDNLKCIL